MNDVIVGILEAWYEEASEDDNTSN
jgi:hypothetical protein